MDLGLQIGYKLFEKLEDGSIGALLREYIPPIHPPPLRTAGMPSDAAKRARKEHQETVREYRKKLEPLRLF